MQGTTSSNIGMGSIKHHPHRHNHYHGCFHQDHRRSCHQQYHCCSCKAQWSSWLVLLCRFQARHSAEAGRCEGHRSQNVLAALCVGPAAEGECCHALPAPPALQCQVCCKPSGKRQHQACPNTVLCLIACLVPTLSDNKTFSVLCHIESRLLLNMIGCNAASVAL